MSKSQAGAGHGKTALVTGARGFIGRTLCMHLQNLGWHVTALLRSPQEGPWDQHICLNLGEDEFSGTTMQHVDTIFHLAASADNSSPSQITPLDRKVNIAGTESLLYAAQQAGVRKFVFISTVKAMGEGESACLDETFSPDPVSSYGRSKLQAEKIVLNQSSVAACVLRLPVVYGDSDQGNLPRMIYAILKQRFPPLPEVNNKRSMIHVRDVAKAAVVASETVKTDGQVFLLTDGQFYSTRQIFEWICQLSEMDIPSWKLPVWALKAISRCFDFLGMILARPMPLDSFALHKLLGSAYYSNQKFCRETGFEPEHNLYEALPDMISAVKSSNLNTH